jgi:hypothetical protein
MAGEGNPDNPAQARSQTSEHVKVVGLLLVHRGEDSDAIPSQTQPSAFTCWSGGESLAGSMELGRQKQPMPSAVFSFGQRLTPRSEVLMSKKRRGKFTDMWVNQTTLGKQFGLSSIAMGKKLKELGLRSEDGTPTEFAESGGYCQSTPLRDGTAFWMWNKKQVEARMQSSGHQKLEPLEVKARELADEWIDVERAYQEAVYKVEEDMLFEDARDLKKEARRLGLVPRVNEILRERNFQGELME